MLDSETSTCHVMVQFPRTPLTARGQFSVCLQGSPSGTPLPAEAAALRGKSARPGSRAPGWRAPSHASSCGPSPPSHGCEVTDGVTALLPTPDHKSPHNQPPISSALFPVVTLLQPQGPACRSSNSPGKALGSLPSGKRART